MNSGWITSPAGRRVALHWADPRPAWLWSQDGGRLLWQNSAARLFNAKLKKHSLKLSQPATPIKGQVARLIRLGLNGRSSLGRVQLLAGEKPMATTCTCTPLMGPDGSNVLLLVGTEPISPEIFEAAGELAPDSRAEAILPPGSAHLVVEAGLVLSGSPRALEAYAPSVEAEGVPPESAEIAVLKASPGGAALIVFLDGDEPVFSIEDLREAEGESADEAMEELLDLAELPEPMLPLGLSPLPGPGIEPAAHTGEDEWSPASEPEAQQMGLSSLFDRLAEDATLYTSLSAADEVFPPEAIRDNEPSQAGVEAPGTVEEPLVSETELRAEPPSVPPADFTAEPDVIAAVIDYADDPEETIEQHSAKQPTEDTPAPVKPPRTHWLITGRGFRSLLSRKAEPPVAPPPDRPPLEVPAQEVEPPAEPSREPLPHAPVLADPVPPEPLAATAPAPSPAPDVTAFEADIVADESDRVSRYNFEELGRILTDRVASEPRGEPEPVPVSTIPSGVVNLNAETLVLNRLPLAIMVFRDQQVLFANRALTDLLGYDSVAALRAAGIASIFPRPDNAAAGPVNQLVRRDGAMLPVGARLQSVSWQGRAALMLSASPLEPIRGHEGAVKAFAELAADAREDGFIAADRSGLITRVSALASGLLGRTGIDLIGRPLDGLAAKKHVAELRAFLEKPARFAETLRPHLTIVTDNGEAEILLFSEGQAGLVTGYFGFVRSRHRIDALPQGDDDIEPSMLGRLSRGLRRPLNTIIGFADLIRSAPSGALEHARVLEYARDIRTAGLEITVLVDELDDFVRLREGQYAVRPSEIGLAALLEDCMARIRPQAAAARVLVRSAISERLPRIRADQASLGQALLNLLASAIDQTPIGGSVILSAQGQEDGSIAVHVRDGAENGTELADRFVVFRDGIDKDGEQMTPVRSTVGLALTRSLLAVNACSLSVDPTAGTGTLFSLVIPTGLIVQD